MNDSVGMMSSVGVVVPELGGPEVLTVRPWEISAPARGEVRVAVDAAAISYADLLVMQGVHPERRTPPFVPGWDVVGEVESVGPDVTNVSVGDRVAGLSIVGGWAEHALLRADWVVPVADSIDATKAVCVVMDYIVAYQMLTRSAHVQPGDTVLFQGVGGGVGTAFMQVARTLDVRVLGTDRERKRDHIEAHGATLIDFETEDIIKRCQELTGGRGVEAAFDGVGETATRSLRAVRRGGHLVWFGMITMLAEGKRDVRKILKTASLVGAAFAPNLLPGGKRTSLYSIQTLARKHPDWYRDDLAALLELLAEGQIDPHIAAVWGLDEVPAAAVGLAHGAMPGKQVINVAAVRGRVDAHAG